MITEIVGMAKMITWWQLILDEIVLVAVLIAGIGFFNRLEKTKLKCISISLVRSSDF